MKLGPRESAVLGLVLAIPIASYVLVFSPQNSDIAAAVSVRPPGSKRWRVSRFSTLKVPRRSFMRFNHAPYHFHLKAKQLRGLADASCVNFNEVFVWHISPESPVQRNHLLVRGPFFRIGFRYASPRILALDLTHGVSNHKMHHLRHSLDDLISGRLRCRDTVNLGMRSECRVIPNIMCLIQRIIVHSHGGRRDGAIFDVNGDAFTIMRINVFINFGINLALETLQQMLEDLNHPFGRGKPVYDITFENVQAGERTSHLFRLANMHGGLVVGTGDLSELALGYTTYGVGDHMSHYNSDWRAPSDADAQAWIDELRSRVPNGG